MSKRIVVIILLLVVLMVFATVPVSAGYWITVRGERFWIDDPETGASMGGLTGVGGNRVPYTYNGLNTSQSYQAVVHEMRAYFGNRGAATRFANARTGARVVPGAEMTPPTRGFYVFYEDVTRLR